MARRVLLIAALGSMSPLAAAAATYVVNIVDGPAFSPANLTVHAGDTVQWPDLGGMHSVSADDATFDSGVTASFAYVFTEVRAFPYHCSVHPFMTGTITVLPPSDESLVTLTAWDFQVDGPAVVPVSLTQNLAREYNGGSVDLYTGLAIPSGSKVTRFEIEGCIDGIDGQVSATLRVCPTNASPCPLDAQAIIFAGATGCFTVTDVLADDEGLIDNVQNSYIVRVRLVADNAPKSFRAVRVFYRRQVIPDNPAAQTFTDVSPSSDQHRFIEALAAAGISTGCGQGNFCPDNPVTRGQLAVLLARAMGLWPN